MNDSTKNNSLILVADDEPANREILSELLEMEGYRTVSAADGAQALDMLRDPPVDLALLDVMMPGRTGFSVCQAAKSDPATRLIPVVLVTGLNRSEDRLKGIESGADALMG